MNVLRPRLGSAWRDEATDAIAALVEDHPHWDTFRPAPVGPAWPPGCYDPDRLDLVTRFFDFRDRDATATVRCQRAVMVRLLRALRDEPLGITVGYGGNATGASFRTCALQAELYHRYLAGIGGKAAPPGESWHNRGVALDAPHDSKGAKALHDHGFEVGQVPGDPSHVTWRVVG